MNETEPKFKVYEDTLDAQLIAAVNDDGVVKFGELPQKHPEFANLSYNFLWYRIHTLAQANRIRVKRERRNLMVYSLED